MHINGEKPNLNQQVHHVNLTLSFRLYILSNTLYLTQICNSCHVIIINYACFAQLLYSHDGFSNILWLTMMFATSGHVLELKGVVIFLKITICFLLSRALESYLWSRMKNSSYFDHKQLSQFGKTDAIPLRACQLCWSALTNGLHLCWPFWIKMPQHNLVIKSLCAGQNWSESSVLSHLGLTLCVSLFGNQEFAIINLIWLMLTNFGKIIIIFLTF